MKKVLIILSGLLLIAVLIIKVASAQNTPQEVKKASTETKMDCGKCPSASSCATMAVAKTTEAKVCDPAKCKEAKCDTTKCKTSCSTAKTSMKSCDQAKCAGMTKK